MRSPSALAGKLTTPNVTSASRAHSYLKPEGATRFLNYYVFLQKTVLMGQTKEFVHQKMH